MGVPLSASESIAPGSRTRHDLEDAHSTFNVQLAAFATYDHRQRQPSPRTEYHGNPGNVLGPVGLLEVPERPQGNQANGSSRATRERS